MSRQGCSLRCRNVHAHSNVNPKSSGDTSRYARAEPRQAFLKKSAGASAEPSPLWLLPFAAEWPLAPSPW